MRYCTSGKESEISPHLLYTSLSVHSTHTLLSDTPPLRVRSEHAVNGVSEPNFAAWNLLATNKNTRPYHHIPVFDDGSSLPLRNSSSYRIRSPFVRHKPIELSALMKLKSIYVAEDASDAKVDVTIRSSKPSGKHATGDECGVGCLNAATKDEQLNHSSGRESKICMSTNASGQEL